MSPPPGLWHDYTVEALLINNKNFLFQEPENGEPMTPCMDIYKSEIKSDGSLDKLKSRVLIR